MKPKLASTLQKPSRAAIDATVYNILINMDTNTWASPRRSTPRVTGHSGGPLMGDESRLDGRGYEWTHVRSGDETKTHGP